MDSAPAAAVHSHSEFVRIRGLRYHVRVWGEESAPLVFLLHGWLDVGATWAPVAQRLATEFRVLCPDWRGFGHSEWPQDGYWFPDYVADLDGLVHHYVPDGAFRLVGHSMGGQAASLYAGLRPQKVSKLVLLDSLFLPDMPAKLAPKHALRWLDQLREGHSERTYPSFEDLARRVRRQHPQLSEERALFIARCWGREDGRGRIVLCADPKHYDNGPALFRVAESMEMWKQVTAPVLFLDAGRSQFRQALSDAEFAARRACFAQRTEDAIADAGHMLHFDAPEETAARVARFLRD